MKYLYVLLLVFCINHFSFGVNHVSIDLQNTKHPEYVKVELTDLKLVNDVEVLFFPSTIPGMYEKNDFGKYVKDLCVHYKNGSIKKVKAKNINVFSIPNANKVNKITYKVKRTNADSKFFQSAGNYFVDNTFLLNFHSLVGYLKSTINEPYKVTIIKTEKLFGEGSLDKISNTKTNVDLLNAKNYHELIDSPFLYSVFNETDTLSYNVALGNIKIAIATNSLNISAQYIKEALDPILDVLAKDRLYSDNFEDSYSFLILFSPESMGVGALEHKKSSVYMFRDTLNIKHELQSIVAHELLHIITPLTLKSNVLNSFDYNNPIFSKHLWLYEGVTEYLSLKCLLNANIIDTTYFFKKLINKYNYSKNHAISLTDFSINILKKKYQNNYELIYKKGCLVAFYIDYLIVKNSDGKRGISDLLYYSLSSLSDENGFNENDFFNNLINKFPELEELILNSVIAEGYSPINYYLDELGVNFACSSVKKTGTFWEYDVNNINFRIDKNFIRIKKQGLNDSIGIRNLKIYKINNKPVEHSDLNYFMFPKTGEKATILIKHRGKMKELEIKPYQTIRTYRQEILTFSNPNDKILNKLLLFGLDV